MNDGIFVVGTGTDVGKTYVSALIAKALKDRGENVAYYKAAMSGNERADDGRIIPGDALFVKSVSGISQPLDGMCPYLYEKAYSPHLAAATEGSPVDMDTVINGFAEVRSKYGFIVAEGSGGIVCPLRFDDKKIFLEDVIKAFSLPCVIVADAGLGTINSVVLTAEYMRLRGLETVGIIFNRYKPRDAICEDNIIMCEKLTGLPVLACVENDGDRIKRRI